MSAEPGEELEAVCERAVSSALDAGAGDAEAFAEDSRSFSAEIFEGQVESLTESGSRGLGVRVWIDGRVGYAFATDLSDEGIRLTCADAVEAARVADADRFATAPEPSNEPASDASFSEPSFFDWTPERKLELAKRVEQVALAGDRIEAVESTHYADELSNVAIRSSRGVEGAFTATASFAYLQAIASEGDGGDRQTGLGFGMGRSPETLDAEAIGAEAAERAASLLGASKPASRTCPVVLDPTVAASFAGFIGGLLSADSVQRGRSPFAGRLGEPIAADLLTLVDDGAAPGGLASAPFDAEGMPAGRTALIEAGELSAYLHDSYTARREGEGVRSTANAGRAGFRSAPSVGPTNLIVEPGVDLRFEDLLVEAGGGVLITDVSGLHSGVNPVSGQFSVGATGRLISAGGDLADPIDEFTIASDLQSMLRAITSIGSEPRWVPFGGSVSTPAILVGEMAIGGS
ncbi:TldD/PmbA family protein [Thermoleophilia bacterium SCSIO 60948]|nr:TldD/PmbA family protein [Thermoleophilia bacterium SCSIO 60948]